MEPLQAAREDDHAPAAELEGHSVARFLHGTST
jgi:hypothetical protein